MKNLEKQQKCTMNDNTGSFDFANATAFASLKMTNNNCHAELVEASRRSRSSVSRAAFTLVELVITIAIVIILSVISVPIYQGYTLKAKRAEGYALLGLILSAQKNYYSEYGNFIRTQDIGYTDHTSYDKVLGIDARGNKYFTCFWSTGSSSDVDPKVYCNFGLDVPADLRIDGNRYLRLNYNVTVGATIFDANV